MARRAQIDPGRLSKLERGVVRVSAVELVRLSRVLGAGLDEIVFGAATSLEAEWHRLQREIENAGGQPALECATKMLHAIVQIFKASPVLGSKDGGIPV